MRDTGSGVVAFFWNCTPPPAKLIEYQYNR